MSPAKKAVAAKAVKKAAVKKAVVRSSAATRRAVPAKKGTASPARKPVAKKAAATKKSSPAKRPSVTKAVSVKKGGVTRGLATSKKTVAPKKPPARPAAPRGKVLTQKKAPPAKKAPAAKTPTKDLKRETPLKLVKEIPAVPGAPKKAAGAKVPEKKVTEEAPPEQTASSSVEAGGVKAARAAKEVSKAAKPSPPPKPPKPTRGPYADDQKFLDELRQLLTEERVVYQNQAEDLRAEAESLALEREPGDVQFDEESGEGGTVAVDRERDLTLSAQALATIGEIDVALEAIGTKMYGACEICGQPIPKARLRALPYARLCVACKSGGLHRR